MNSVSHFNQLVWGKTQVVLGLAALTSGAALVAAILLEASLALTFLLLAALAILIVTLKLSQTTAAERTRLRAQLVTGIIAGITATIAYDIARLLLVELGQLSVSPFKAFPIFGELIIGPAPENIRILVGTVYHAFNGISFAVGYCLLLGGRNWTWGVAWGLLLESAMLTIYPGWLDLEAVMAEFVSMSVLGHVVYGAVLGVISQRRLGESRLRAAESLDHEHN